MNIQEGIRESKINFNLNDKINVLILVNHNIIRVFFNEHLHGEFKNFMADISIKHLHKAFSVRGILSDVIEFKSGVVIEVNKIGIYIYDSMTQFLRNKKNISDDLFFVPYLSE